MKLGEQMSKKTVERAERAEKERVKKARKVQEKADKTEKGRIEKARKVQDKADKTEENRVEKAKKVQDKADKTEKGRVEKATEHERSRVFDDVLSAAGKIKGCCDSCTYHVKRRGEYQPCKRGHDDSGQLKESCADCSEPSYHSKPSGAA
jgi:hypothetical protein